MTSIFLGNLGEGTNRHFNPETREFEGLMRAVGNMHVLKHYEYHPVDRTLTSRTYGNGDIVSYEYDFLRRVTEVEHCDGTRFTYSYTGDGQLHEIREYTRDVDAFVLRRSYEYTYDTLGNIRQRQHWDAPFDPRHPWFR